MVSDDNSNQENIEHTTLDERASDAMLEDTSSLLTPKQRSYLRDESEIEPRSPEERSIRNRIRNRLLRGLYDLDLLSSNIQNRDLTKVFDSPDLLNSIKDVFSLVFDGLSSSIYDEQEHEEPSDEVLDMYADFVEGGIEQLYRRRGFDVKEVEVSIEIEFGESTEKLKQQSPADLSISELTLLLQNDEISREEFTEILEQNRPYDGGK
jgi:hypothetical protein